MVRRIWFVLAVIALSACDDKAAQKPASASAVAPVSSEEADRLPAVAVEAESPPKYSLSKLSDKDLSTLITRAGWKVTVLGKNAPDSKASRVRATAVKLDKEGNLESFTSVSCGETKTDHPAGSAYYDRDGCTLLVEVRRGIRAKTEESRKLLGALLAASL